MHGDEREGLGMKRFTIEKHNDPLAIDSRGWNPRDHGEMWWDDEPQIAFIAPPELTGATKAKTLDYAGRFDHTNYIGDAEWVNLRVRRAWYRWDAPAIARELEQDRCPCRIRMCRAWRMRPEPRFPVEMPNVLCVAGDALCGRPRYLSVSEMWEENGAGCPWVACDRTDPMAVTWIHVWDSVASDGPR